MAGRYACRIERKQKGSCRFGSACQFLHPGSLSAASRSTTLSVPSKFTDGLSNNGYAASSSSADGKLRNVVRPHLNPTWSDECWRLEKRYRCDGFLAQDQCDGTRLVRLRLQCTDPDWDQSWSPRGLVLDIAVPQLYPLSISAKPTLKIVNPEGLPALVVRLLPKLFDEGLAGVSQGMPRAITCALHHVDRHIARLFQKAISGFEPAETRALPIAPQVASSTPMDAVAAAVAASSTRNPIKETVADEAHSSTENSRTNGSHSTNDGGNETGYHKADEGGDKSNSTGEDHKPSISDHESEGEEDAESSEEEEEDEEDDESSEDEDAVCVAVMPPAWEACPAQVKTESSEAKNEVVESSTEWSHEEQARLESALILFQSEKDVKKKWIAIARHVGGGRSVKDCTARYKACREKVMSAKMGLQNEPEQSLESSSSAAGIQYVAPEAWSAEDVKRQGVKVRFEGLIMQGFGTLLPYNLKFQVVCGRCKKPSDLVTELVSGARLTDVRTAESPCPICRQEVALRIAPNIAHSDDPTVAYVQGVSCHPTDLLRSDFEATCLECNGSVRIRELGPGYRKKANCPSCFSKLNLVVEGSDLDGKGVEKWRQVAQSERDALDAKQRVNEERRREKQDLGIQAGAPLPKNGACKHYRKSRRWLRFPCCGKAFPCDTCHDEATDHPFEWATRMLCGFCSREQPFSQKPCIHCGTAQVKERTAHWEGGEGCRDTVAMSKKDSKKYRGLGKTISSKIGAKIMKK